MTTLAAAERCHAAHARARAVQKCRIFLSFPSRCVHLPELIRAINSALSALRERQSLRRQQEENRSLLARQYAGITDILRQLGAEVTQDVTAQPMMEKQIRRYAGGVRMDRPRVRGAHAQGRLIVELYGDGIADILRQGEGFSAGLSALLDVALTEPREMENEFGTCLEMHERAPFRAVVGIGRQQRSGVSVSGDSGCWFLTDAGVARLLLADGMGSGAAAAQDSRMLVSSMERFLRAGIPLSDALGADLSGAAASLTARASSPLDALTLDLIHRAGGEPEMRRGALLCAHGRALERARREIASRRPFRREKTRASRCRCGFPTAICSSWCQTAFRTGWMMMRGARAAARARRRRAEGARGSARHRGPGRGSDDDRTAIVMRVEKTNF